MLSAEDLATRCERPLRRAHLHRAPRRPARRDQARAVPAGAVRLGRRCVAARLRPAGGGRAAPDVRRRRGGRGRRGDRRRRHPLDGPRRRSPSRGAADLLRPVRVPRACPGRAGARVRPRPGPGPLARPRPPPGALPRLARASSSTWSRSPRRAATRPSRGPRPPPSRSSWPSSTGWDPRAHRPHQAAGTPGRWALLDRRPLAPVVARPGHPARRRRAPDVPVLRPGRRPGDRGRRRPRPLPGRGERQTRPPRSAATRRPASPAPPACRRSATPAATSTTSPTAPSQRARDQRFAGADAAGRQRLDLRPRPGEPSP